MTKRTITAERERRLKRRDLVHAAGCTHRDCVVRLCAFEEYGMINEAMADGIRVPRSIARHWGAALIRSSEAGHESDEEIGQ